MSKHVVTDIAECSPQYLSDRCDISLSVAKRYLKGCGNPSLSTFEKISKGLRKGITVVVLTFIQLREENNNV